MNDPASIITHVLREHRLMSRWDHATYGSEASCTGCDWTSTIVDAHKTHQGEAAAQAIRDAGIALVGPAIPHRDWPGSAPVQYADGAVRVGGKGCGLVRLHTADPRLSVDKARAVGVGLLAAANYAEEQK